VNQGDKNQPGTAMERRFFFIKYVQLLIIFNLACWLDVSLFAQPQPGDIFREYDWIMPPEGEKFLRVGGKLDYRLTPDKFSGHILDKGGGLLFSDQIDLKQATKAELTLEKLLSHEDTKGLRVSFNGNPYQMVPEASQIPEPQSDYYHHFYPTIEIPLDYLKVSGNRICLAVGSAQEWNWPQHLIYGLILRIYYDRSPEQMQGEILVEGNKITATTKIRFQPELVQSITKVDFIGKYTGLDYEGNGVYDQWHYHHHRGQLTHHIGTGNQQDFTTSWNTEWLPDQPDPIAVSAWVSDSTGLTYFLPPLKNLQIERDYSIELCKPYDQPERWVTRGDKHTQKVRIEGDLKKAVAAKLVWTSWSPGYMNGLYVNDFLIFIRGGEKYAYEVMEVPLNYNLFVLKAGENTISTGKTPLYEGQMVHGMEVMWPGIMLLVKYKNRKL